MSTYHVLLHQTVGTVLDVEAESTEDAIEKAYAEAPSSLCHHCAREVEMGNDWEIFDITEGE